MTTAILNQSSPNGFSMRHRTIPQRHSEGDYTLKRNGIDNPLAHQAVAAEDTIYQKRLSGGFDADEGRSMTNVMREKDDAIQSNQHRVLVLGLDISHFSRPYQFILSASGVFGFSLLYGYLQELIAVTICGRQLGLFLAIVQFIGYVFWSRVLHDHVENKTSSDSQHLKSGDVPPKLYIMLALLRATDASMTNMSMKYINYPCKTLMKSSRVVFTMILGTVISRKKYKRLDYAIVLLMVTGLAIFMHADANSSAVFHPLGVIMLTVSLICDGAMSNMGEKIMTQYNVGQDEYMYKLYSVTLLGIVGAAASRGDLLEGAQFLFTAGTYDEIMANQTPTWSVLQKIVVIILFSSTGFFGSSCSALITKEFGALTMSITSTARKATTLFLSFALFNNVCTFEHVSGIVIFISALVAKSFRASRKGHGGSHRSGHEYQKISSFPESGSPIEVESFMERSPAEDTMKKRTNRPSMLDMV